MYTMWRRSGGAALLHLLRGTTVESWDDGASGENAFGSDALQAQSECVAVVTAATETHVKAGTGKSEVAVGGARRIGVASESGT